MIVLRCAVCGHEVAVSDSLRDVGIRCARCGNPLAVKPPPDQAKTEMSGVPAFDTGQAGQPTSQASDEDTFSPHQPPRPITFSFLSPPRHGNELGSLGPYRVVRLIGQGGMGIVFEAVDGSLDRSVALKVMKPESAQDESARQRFLREAQALAAVHSDHVVTVHQVGEANHLPYLAMEFLQGEPLDEWHRRRGQPSVDEIVQLGMQIARGLAAAHGRGLIHRDIKPGNIFLERNDGASFRVKILDFGLARSAGARARLTDPGRVIGTPGYMAPEQIEGLALDARGDLFSLGCILYELSTGEPPFEASNAVATLMAVLQREPAPPRRLNPRLPAALEHLIQRLMAKAPAGRPASAREVVETLEKLSAPHADAKPALASAGRGRWMLAAAALGAAILTGGLLWLAWRYWPA